MLLPLILDWLLNMRESKKQILSFEIGLFSLQNTDYGQNLISQSRYLDFRSTSDCLMVICKIINIVYSRTCSVTLGNLRISILEILVASGFGDLRYNRRNIVEITVPLQKIMKGIYWNNRNVGVYVMLVNSFKWEHYAGEIILLNVK